MKRCLNRKIDIQDCQMIILINKCTLSVDQPGSMHHFSLMAAAQRSENNSMLHYTIIMRDEGDRESRDRKLVTAI